VKLEKKNLYTSVAMHSEHTDTHRLLCIIIIIKKKEEDSTHLFALVCPISRRRHMVKIKIFATDILAIILYFGLRKSGGTFICEAWSFLWRLYHA
jgi:hypothetical protein